MLVCFISIKYLSGKKYNAISRAIDKTTVVRVQKHRAVND